MARLKKALAVVASGAIALAALLGAGTWLIVRDEVSRLRSISATTSVPLAPVLVAAIVAAEDPVLQVPRFSVRALLPRPRRTVYCGPASIAFALVRSMSPPRRMWRWHVETAVTAYVVAHLFTPEELLRIYAHEVYLGSAGHRHVYGVETASGVYFGKATRDLTPAEAAMIAAMIRSPNVYSPVRHPERALERRNKVLERMHRLGSIGQQDFQSGIAEPLRTRPV